MPAEQALDTASASMKQFMVKNTRKTDLALFSDIAETGTYEDLRCALYGIIACLYYF